jgi:hypothetical protein
VRACIKAERLAFELAPSHLNRDTFRPTDRPLNCLLDREMPIAAEQQPTADGGRRQTAQRELRVLATRKSRSLPNRVPFQRDSSYFRCSTVMAELTQLSKITRSLPEGVKHYRQWLLGLAPPIVEEPSQHWRHHALRHAGWSHLVSHNSQVLMSLKS